VILTFSKKKRRGVKKAFGNSIKKNKGLPVPPSV